MIDRMESRSAGFGGRRQRAPRRVGTTFGVIGLALVATGLTGCGDRMLETGFGYGYFFDDPPPDVDPAPPIRRITGANPAYPLLGTVPARPPTAPSEAERQERLARLTGDVRAGRLADQVLKEEAPQPGPPPGYIAPPDAGPSLLQTLNQTTAPPPLAGAAAPGAAGATAPAKPETN